jgi:alanine dehydrogenase
MSRRIVVLARVVSILALAIASRADAQRIPADRFGRSSSLAPNVMAADSAAHYLHQAKVQRSTGASLIALGVAGIAAAYVSYAHGGQMGMNGAQVATLAAGTAVGAVGVTRLATSRTSYATAARWNDEHLASQH